MSRLVDVTGAMALLVLFGPAYLLTWALSASRSDYVQRVLRRGGFDNILLLGRVLQGRLTLGEWARVSFRH